MAGRQSKAPAAPAAPALTIADLPEAEKARITHLVDRLMTLGREHEETMSSLSHERARHAAEIDAANRRIEEELGVADEKVLQQSETIIQLQEQRAAAFSLLKKYQARLESYEADTRLRSRSAEEAAQKAAQLAAQVDKLETLVQKQRSSIDEMEAASTTTKKTFQDTLDLAEDRYRRATEEAELLKEKVSSLQRRGQGLESAIAGLTKQIATLNKAGINKDEALAEMKRSLDLQEQALQKEREAVAAARTEAATYSAAAASATATAAAANAAAQAALRSKKKALKKVADLAASRTSSEMLLYDTMDTATLGEATPERKITRKKASGEATTRARQFQPAGPESSFTSAFSTRKGHISENFHHEPDGKSSRGSSGAATNGSKSSAVRLASKKSSRDKSSVSAASSSKSSSLAVELGEQRNYDSSLLFVLDSL